MKKQILLSNITQTHIEIRGIVQGVGFRPFVYVLALKLNLKGFVNNSESGVNIVLQGDSASIDTFLQELKSNPPSLAKIDTIEIKSLKSSHIYSAFTIDKTEVNKSKISLVSPDIAVCNECLEDISKPNNFRFNYALTNCTNCGPRYSILKTVPFDRANTSMSEFILCKKCQKEYDAPDNRRYHAQAICCEKCGPKVSLYNKSNIEIKDKLNAIKELAKQIKQGHIVAIKSLGGFHLVCDATNANAIKKLRERKKRPTKPLAVMFKNLEEILKVAKLSKKESEIVVSKQRPIVLVQKNSSSLLANELTFNIDYIGVFLPFTPLQHLLFNYVNIPIVATSANISDEPIITKRDELYEKLSSVFEYVLDYNREIVNACDDSVVQVINDKLFYLRKARGYAPYSLKLSKNSSKKILALGANQKNTIALYFNNVVIVTPHMGDLNSIASMEFFNSTIETFKQFYDFSPELIVCDKHPAYETTKWAKKQNLPIVQIQHHYAHILSCMAQYNLKNQLLAFAFDGTGYGDDGNIWGGEVFLASHKEYKRVKHFKYFKLLGGEVAIKQIKRLGLSLLFENYSLKELFCLDNPCVKAFSNKDIELLHTMWKRNLNAPLSSSVGRLFDAVCSIAGLKQSLSYEGESGLLIEKAYDKSIKDSYLYKIHKDSIDINQAIKQMVKEKNARVICSKFINMLSEIIVTIAKQYPNLELVLTGGVFQNRTLLQLVCKKLHANNRKFYYSKEAPLNDAGVALGQIYSQLKE